MASSDQGKISRRDFFKLSAGSAAGGMVTASCAAYKGQEIADPNPQMQGYLNYGFIRYPDELGKLCDHYWDNKKPVKYISTLARQLFAMGNDILELPFELTAKVADDVGHAHFGGKKKGEPNKYVLKRFVKYTFDSIPGGKGNDEIVDMIAGLDIKGAFEYARNVEDTELGANMKIGSVGFFNFLYIDAALKAAFGGRSLLEKMFGLRFHGDGDKAAASRGRRIIIPGERGPGDTPADPF